MDMQILLALQSFRQSAPSFIETFLGYLSYIGDGPGLIAIALIVYWCIDKHIGQFTILALGAATFISQFIKTIACVYRPWILNPNISPAEIAVEGATGYSFPSGHATGTTATFGSFAWLLRKDYKPVVVGCITIIVLMCFARLFFCVHTPQDVLCGVVIAVLCIVMANYFTKWIERYDALMPYHNKDILVLVITIVICVVALIIVNVKPYPMDYVDGQLIVDPVVMQKNAFEGTGVILGVVLGWVCERRMVDFTTEGLDMRGRIIRFVVGVAIVGIVYVVSSVLFKMFLPLNWAKFVQILLVAFMGVFVAPLIFSKLEQRMGYNV